MVSTENPSASSKHQKTERTDIKQFYTFTSSILLQYSIIGLLNPYIAIYFRQEGLPFGLLFLIFLANSLGNLAQPVWGGLSDRFNKRKIFLVIASISWILSTTIIWMFPEFLIFVIFFGLASCLGSANQPVGRSLITLTTSDNEETEYQSKFGVLLSTAFSICSWIGGFVVSYYGFNHLFFLTMILSFLSFGFVLLVKDKQVIRNQDNAKMSTFIETKNESNYKNKAIDLLKNKKFILVATSSFLGSMTFYLFYNFISVFLVESGVEIITFSWTFLVSFILFITVNYVGEAIVKNKIKQNEEIQHENKNENIMHSNGEFSIGPSERLKSIFITWSILGYLALCLIITFLPNALILIIVVYSLPMLPFFFTSMLALTVKTTRAELKGLAVGIQGIFVFLGRSLSIYIGAILLDGGGFQLTAFINLFFVAVLILFVLLMFKNLNLID